MAMLHASSEYLHFKPEDCSATSYHTGWYYDMGQHSFAFGEVFHKTREKRQGQSDPINLGINIAINIGIVDGIGIGTSAGTETALRSILRISKKLSSYGSNEA